jgi:hypothetical protein
MTQNANESSLFAREICDRDSDATVISAPGPMPQASEAVELLTLQQDHLDRTLFTLCRPNAKEDSVFRVSVLECLQDEVIATP